VLQRAGLKPMRFHDLRHSAVSILTAAGVHPKTVQLFARHAQIATTMDVYSHLGERAIQEASAALASALG
jgi:integrase